VKAWEPKSNEWYETLVRLTGKDKLCETCNHQHVCDDETTKWCIWGFWPVTSDGKNCPYYNVPGVFAEDNK